MRLFRGAASAAQCAAAPACVSAGQVHTAVAVAAQAHAQSLFWFEAATELLLAGVSRVVRDLVKNQDGRWRWVVLCRRMWGAPVPETSPSVGPMRICPEQHGYTCCWGCWRWYPSRMCCQGAHSSAASPAADRQHRPCVATASVVHSGSSAVRAPTVLTLVPRTGKESVRLQAVL